MADDNKDLAAEQKKANETLAKIHDRLNKPLWVTGKQPKKSAEEKKEDKDAAKKQNDYLQDISDNILKMRKDIIKSITDTVDKWKEKSEKSLGVAFAAIAAPILMIIGFFQGIGPQLKWMKKVTGKGLSKLFAPLKALFQGEGPIGKAVASIGRSIKAFGTAIKESKAFKTLANLGKSLTGSKAFQGIGKLGTSIKNGVTALGKFLKPVGEVFKSIFSWGKKLTTMTKVSRTILKFASGFGRVLGKIFLPITILISAFDFVTGFMEGYEKDGILGGMEVGLTKMFKGLIGMPLDLIKSAVSWIGKKLGFDTTAMDEFSFEKLIGDMISGTFGFIKKAVEWIKLLFTDPKKALQELWDGLLNKAASIGKWITDNVFKPAITWVKDKFNWAADAWEKWSFMDTMKAAWTSAKNWFSEKFEWGKSLLPDWDIVGGIKSFVRDFVDGVPDALQFLVPDGIRKWAGTKPAPDLDSEAEKNKRAGQGGQGEIIAPLRSKAERLEENERLIANTRASIANIANRKGKGAAGKKSIEEMNRLSNQLKGLQDVNKQIKGEGAVKKAPLITPLSSKTGIDWGFISKKEGGSKLEGYVPNPEGSKSGVTVATGFDLGARGPQDIKGLTPELQAKLMPFLGLKGPDAAAALAAQGLKITAAEAKEIDKMSKSGALSKLKREWNANAQKTGGKMFSDLSSAQKTVAASVAFQYGSLSKTPTFQKLAQSGNWTGATKELENFGDAYSTRRLSEAALLRNESGMQLAQLQRSKGVGGAGGGGGTVHITNRGGDRTEALVNGNAPVRDSHVQRATG